MEQSSAIEVQFSVYSDWFLFFPSDIRSRLLFSSTRVTISSTAIRISLAHTPENRNVAGSPAQDSIERADVVADRLGQQVLRVIAAKRRPLALSGNDRRRNFVATIVVD
jgi:hypothetical protein